MTGPAVVLGSAEDPAHVDPARAAAAGMEVARRRSGGGAVLLLPGSVVWADVVVPAGDPLWERDVGRAAWWVGEAWARALEALGAAGPAAAVEVHRGGLVRSAWSDRVCFAGLGPGEVRVGGRKVVGVSQRRTRAGAVFQCAALLGWDPAPLVDVLALPGASARAQAVAELAEVATGLGRDAAEVEAALLDALA